MKFSAIVLFLISSVAHAYIPPSEYILKTMVEKRKGYRTVKIKSTVSGFSGEKPTGATFKELTTYDFASRLLRSRAYDEAGVELYVMERRLGTLGGENGRTAFLADSLLLEQGLAPLIVQLHGVDIPVKPEEELLKLKDEEERRAAEVTSLTRWKGTLSWVIGSPVRLMAKDEHRLPLSAQVWIEKDAFLPNRLIVPAGEGFGDIRFERYRFTKEFPFPRMLTAVRIPGKENVDLLADPSEGALLRAEVTDVVVNSDEKEPRLKTTPGYTDAGNAAPSPVRELIQAYYEFVR